MSVTLKEYNMLPDEVKEDNFQSADHSKHHIVQQGETLTSIAANLYDNPTAWRFIAERNNIYFQSAQTHSGFNAGSPSCGRILDDGGHQDSKLQTQRFLRP